MMVQESYASKSGGSPPHVAALPESSQGLGCDNPNDYKHAPTAGSKTGTTGFYTRLMCEYVMYAMYFDIVIKHVPAMPATQTHDEPQPHRI